MKRRPRLHGAQLVPIRSSSLLHTSLSSTPNCPTYFLCFFIFSLDLRVKIFILRRSPPPSLQRPDRPPYHHTRAPFFVAHPGASGVLTHVRTWAHPVLHSGISSPLRAITFDGPATRDERQDMSYDRERWTPWCPSHPVCLVYFFRFDESADP